MTSHVGDEIPGMLRGDALRHEALTSAAHLRGCSDCQDELISALVAHVALTSTARLLRRTGPIGIEIADDDSATPVLRFPFDESGAAPISGSKNRPVAVVSETVAPMAHSRHGRRRGLAAGAAALLAAAGVAGVFLSPGSASRSVSLSAYGVGTSNATAEFIGVDVDIRANLPALSGGSYYEVWLTDASRTVMTPVGELVSPGSTELSLSRDVVSRFADIEVSVESPANGSEYSGLSVLRGQYKPA
jgi:hypothetical protein